MTNFADRAFRCSDPAVWNSLTADIVNSCSLQTFKRKLKTFLISYLGMLSVLLGALCPPAPLKSLTFWRYTNQIIIIITIIKLF